jgi:hypothetical protein
MSLPLRPLVSQVVRGDGAPAAHIKIPIEHVSGSFTDTHTIPGRQLPPIETDEYGAFVYPLWPNEHGETPSFYRITLFGRRIRIWIPAGEEEITLSQARVLAMPPPSDPDTLAGLVDAWLTARASDNATGFSYTTGTDPEPPAPMEPNSFYIQVDE